MVQEHKSSRDALLSAQGWTRRFSAGPPRLEEAVEGYRELGFEVLLEPVDTSRGSGCTVCIIEHPDDVKVIYTRPS